MNAASGKAVSIVSVSVAVIVSAWAVMRVMDDRRDIARDQANKAVAQAEKAKQSADEQISREKALEKQAALTEASRKLKEAELAKAKLDAEQAEAAAKAAQELADTEAEKAKAEAEKAKAEKAKAAELARAEEARAAAERQETERVRLQAEADAKAAAARQKLAETETEKVRISSERILAEAKLAELRSRSLDERERLILAAAAEVETQRQALRAEKEMTIKDLVTTGSDPSEAKEEGPVLPENDRTLPRESRALARSERMSAERLDAIRTQTRSDVVQRFERLYLDAIREDRISDATFYRKELKRMYPDWEYKPPKKEEVKK